MRSDKQRDTPFSVAAHIDYALSSLRYRPGLPTCCSSHGWLHGCTVEERKEFGREASESSKSECEMRHMFSGAQRRTRPTKIQRVLPPPPGRKCNHRKPTPGTLNHPSARETSRRHLPLAFKSAFKLHIFAPLMSRGVV